MPLSKAQCTNCGGVLEVDSSKDAAICPFCNTPYVIEKAITLFQNNYNNFNITVEGVKPEQILKNAFILLQNNDKDGAKKLLDDYKKYSPEDWRLWFAYAYSESDELLFIENIERAIKHSPNDNKFSQMLDIQKQCVNMKKAQDKLGIDQDNCRLDQEKTYETMGKDPAILDPATKRKLISNKNSGIAALIILGLILILVLLNKAFWVIFPWLMFAVPIGIWTVIPIDKLSSDKIKLNLRESTREKFDHQIAEMQSQINSLEVQRMNKDEECRKMCKSVMDEILSSL